MIEKYYEPKYLYGVIKELAPVNAFFRKNFFNQTVAFPTESVTFENMKADKRPLPFANPDMPAPVVGRTGYSARNYTPPLVSGSRVINFHTLESKLPGESPYNSGIDIETRAAELAANDLEELQAGIQRREEIMCAQLKQNGKIIIEENSIDGVIEYGFENIETAGTGTIDKWTAGYDVLGKLQEINKKLLMQGTNGDMLILGTKAADALINNTKIAKLLDNRRVNFGEITPSQLADGVQYLGKLAAPGLFVDLFCYNDFYFDEKSGEMKSYIDESTVILQSSQEKNFMLYGAVAYIDANGNDFVSANEYVPYVAVQQNPPVRQLIVASRPLPMPADISSWYVLKDVA